MLLKTLVGYVNKGIYAKWGARGLDRNHRIEAEVRGIFRDIWIHESPDDDMPLPWRLSQIDRNMLDHRMSTVIWPHYIERMYYRGHSFWTVPNRVWKTIRKVRLLYDILPTQLRDKVPAVRQALHFFVWGMKRLDGQVHSYDEANRLGILPGSRAVVKTEISKAHNDIIKGLVLFEGCLPASNLNPAMHHFVHYSQYTRTHGPLRTFWMFYFERYFTVNVMNELNINFVVRI